VDFSKKWPPGICRSSKDWPPSRGRGPPYSIVCSCYRKATYEKRGNHYQDAKRKGIRMESRNEMCRANGEEGTTGYAN
jgi:hypothetical protein